MRKGGCTEFYTPSRFRFEHQLKENSMAVSSFVVGLRAIVVDLGEALDAIEIHTSNKRWSIASHFIKGESRS
ncbi:hypothetical protein [Nitrobacter sp. TKz-YC02]|uniref:hypothetical protein n=1 Tax=Nitrobacter sp. TKz-YC02 TaxID=3398704 RepID=UPI003CF2DB88